MKALVYKGAGLIELNTVSIPEPSDDEVLVRIRSIGICGSDVEGYLGKTGRRIPPMIMGHELAGEVIKSPSGSSIKEGDRVTIQPKLYCGECSYCKEGKTNICPNGKFLGVMETNGGLAEYVAVPERNVFKTKHSLPWEKACMVEPLAVAFHAVDKVDRLQLEEAGSVYVVGAGTIGLLVLQVLKYQGVNEVIVSDLNGSRLKKAMELGASRVINPTEELVPRNFDFSFEAVGIGATAAQSLSSLEIGGTVVWIGNAQKFVEVNMQEIVTRELNVIGSFIYNEQDFNNCLKLIENGEVNFDSILHVEQGLEKGPSIFQSLGNNPNAEIIKVVITL